jgi:GNAT superfamily N-acetyltransferase
MITQTGSLNYDRAEAQLPAETAQPPAAAPPGLTLKGPVLGQAEACTPILLSLPEWFGIEAANDQYIEDIDRLPTLIASLDGSPVGFLTLNEHTPHAAEIHVMGVRPEAHRQGIGRALVHAAEAYLTSRGIMYLQVKTLSPDHPDVHYAATRQFYIAMGFAPLQTFEALWGPENPCLQMVKKLD